MVTEERTTGSALLRYRAGLALIWVGADAPKKNAFRSIGHGLIFLAISVLGVYFYLKLVAGQPVDAGTFLPYHLTGITGGIAVLGLGYLVNRRETHKQR